MQMVDHPGLQAHIVRGLFSAAGEGAALVKRLQDIRVEVSKAIAEGARLIVLSDRDGDADNAPIPSLLLTAAVHHHLIRDKNTYEGRPNC